MLKIKNSKYCPSFINTNLILCLWVYILSVSLFSPLLSLSPLLLPLLSPYIPEGGTVYPRSTTDANVSHLNGRAMCQIVTHKHTHTLHGKKSHQDILILFGCSPPLPCASLPASRTHSTSVMILHTG